MAPRRTYPVEGPQSPPLDVTPAEVPDLSRRHFLSRLAAAGVVAVGAGSGALALVSYREDAAASTKDPAHAWCMVIDLRSCDGCKLCTTACQKRHQLPTEQTWIKVNSVQDSAGGTYAMPVPCMMCENPPCMHVCPVNANFRTAEGLVLVDQEVCVGSRACMAACPYEARYFNWSEPAPVKRMPFPPTPEMPVPQQKGTVGKCVLCADRLPHGELPACVDECPMGVLYIGDLVTDVAVNGLGTTVVLSEFLHANDAVRFKEELGTSPRVYYILGHGQNLGQPESQS